MAVHGAITLHSLIVATIDQAIKAHDGEAAQSRDAYLQLPSGKVKQLLDFLSSI